MNTPSEWTAEQHEFYEYLCAVGDVISLTDDHPMDDDMREVWEFYVQAQEVE